MDSNEGIELFDKKLEELENELQDMNKKYGFDKYATFGKTNKEEDFIMPEPEQLTVKPIESTSGATLKKMLPRYENLPPIEAEVTTKTLPRKQISDKWSATLKAAPRLEDLYDKNYYEPEYNDVEQIRIQARLVGGVDLLSQEIDKYADEYTSL